VIVAEEQVRMLLDAGYSPVAIVDEKFVPARVWSDVELRYLPGVQRDNEVRFYTGWEESVRRLYEAMKVALEGIDVVLTHDLIYQPAMLFHNIAARQIAKEKPNILWLNWVHSASASQVQKEARVSQPFPNGKLVFPNEYSRPRVAKNFKTPEADVVFVPHSTDTLRYLGADELTSAFVKDRTILDADVILTYPVRLDRGKQVEHVFALAAALKELGKVARVVVCDFHSTGPEKNEYRDWLKKMAIGTLGLNEHEFSFTSEYDPRWQTSVPRETVRIFMNLSNVFMLPSRSETYSLIAQEAALCGNLLIFNYDFPAMRSIYGDKALYYKFSSDVDMGTGEDGNTNTTYADAHGYFLDIAKRVLYELENNFVLNQKTRVRKARNPEAVFRSHIEPLFYSR
jgi:glycosyltransferase involved in cell wall biosynthesis